MKVLGVRTSPTVVRYAILDNSTGNIKFLNSNAEHKIEFPANLTETSDKLLWLVQEIDRIIRQNSSATSPLDAVVIKSNEYGRGGETANSREAAYYDAVVQVAAAKNTIPVELKLYRSLGTRRADVVDDAESTVGRTNKYWDVQAADAVVAALAAF